MQEREAILRAIEAEDIARELKEEKRELQVDLFVTR